MQRGQREISRWKMTAPVDKGEESQRILVTEKAMGAKNLPRQSSLGEVPQAPAEAAQKGGG